MEQIKFTLGQAAKRMNVSKPTLSRWIKKGRITAQRQDNGSYLIDASELDRIGEMKERGNGRNSNDNPEVKRMETPSEIRVLQKEIELLRERLDDKEETIRDLRAGREREQKEKERLLGIVENQTRLLSPPTKNRTLWQRLTGKKSA